MFFWYWGHYPHRSRYSVSPVCRIFFLSFFLFWIIVVLGCDRSKCVKFSSNPGAWFPKWLDNQLKGWGGRWYEEVMAIVRKWCYTAILSHRGRWSDGATHRLRSAHSRLKEHIACQRTVWFFLFNRPSIAASVLQSPPSLINSLTQLWFVEISS